MAKEYFKNLPDTSTPLTATRFNGLLDGEEPMGNLVVGSIRAKNMFDKSTIVAGDITGSNKGNRLSSRQVLWLEAGTYTFSCNIASPYRYGILVQNTGIPPLSSATTFIYDAGWKTASNPTTTFTINTAGWVTISFSKEDSSALTPSNVIGFNYQLELGNSATPYSPYNAYGSNNLKNENIVVGSIRSKNIINTNAFLGMNAGIGSFKQLETGARITTGNTQSNQWANFLLPNDLLGKKCTFSLKASASSSNVPMARIFYGSPTNMTNITANFDLYGTGLKSKTKTFLSTLPSGCTNIYMILYSNRDGSGFSAGAYADFENLQLEIGDEQTSYSPYQDLENQEIYSTGEIKIGTWIDGKPLYRKTIIVTSINANANSINVNHGISNMDVVASIKGAAKITGANEYRPLSCMYINDSGALDSQYLFNVYGITPSQITLSYGNWFKTRFDRAYITLEYTKTTN